MLLSQHASNVATSGHQWNTTLNNGGWDWVVLQDQSQVPGLPRTDTYWINSNDGAVELAEVIEDNGGETVLMMTWGRRAGDGANPWHGYNQRFSNFSNMQDELASGYLDYRDNITANGDTAWVAPVGLAFEHIHDKIVAEGGTPTNSGNTFYNLYTGDGSHPSLSGSYLAAAVIYATITGNDPVGLSHSTSLSNGLVLELQQAAAATVFNETSHLDYPWQTNSNGKFNVTINEPLGWESGISLGTNADQDIIDYAFTSTGEIYVYGTTRDDVNLGQNCYLYHNLSSTSTPVAPFVAKFSSNHTCLWVSSVEGQDATMPLVTFSQRPEYRCSIAVDDNDGLIITSYFKSLYGSRTVSFGDYDVYPTTSISHEGYISKISANGTWEWVTSLGHTLGPFSIAVESSGDIVVAYSNYGSNDGILSKFSPAGNLISSTTYASEGLYFTSIAIDENDNTYLSGYWSGNTNIAQYSLTGSLRQFLVMKINNSGSVDWVQTPTYSQSTNWIWDIKLDNNSDVILIGDYYSGIEIGNNSFSGTGSTNGFLAKISKNGVWEWAKNFDCSCYVNPRSVLIDGSNNIIVSGFAGSDIVSFGGGIYWGPTGSSDDIFVTKFDRNGTSSWTRSAGGSNHESVVAMELDSSGKLHLSGTFESQSITFGNNLINQGSRSIYISIMTIDSDNDEIPNSLDFDDDNDLVVDVLDYCSLSITYFISNSINDHDSDGCHDDIEDDDDDNDQLNDTLDNCPKGMTGWIRTSTSDLDGDGCMDALEDYDDDNDGFEDYEDYCSRIPGNSTMEFEKGCPDSDGDGRPDILDPFKYDPTEWQDTDGDLVGDNSDAFYLDATQWSDTDGDTYGDEEFGNAGDSCPTVFGTSTIDRYGCLDTDGDGWSDEGDDFPNDPTEYLDTDGDGVSDELDAFPFDPTQQNDSDGDGYGDNPLGNLGDSYPDDPNRHADSDRDGIDDDSDAFPYDPTQAEDKDGDGMGDNPMGIGADKFPNDPTQWGDIDGDGYGDNPSGTNPDAFRNDATQWSDADGDGYGDNPAGRMYDMFPSNPTQWIDEDGDGLGDNQNGTDADPYLNDFDNDGYNDTIDILPRLASPGDLDADGCMDEVDAFKDNAQECLDTDGDGIGDNSDADDDNDLVTDADEIRSGTDPLDPNDTPIDSFEVQIGEIGLGAWDLIGIFGGLPIFGWILFGFVTRNGRCARYEEELENAKSRDELEQVALKWEYSLMLRLLGPHQGIRLERIRAELDDNFQDAENMMTEGFAPITDVDQTPLFEPEQKLLPEIGAAPPIDAIADQIDENGYSWLMHDGKQWYRTNSESNWFEFES